MQEAKTRHAGVNEKYISIPYVVALKKKHFKTLGWLVATDSLDETPVSPHVWEPYY